MTDAADQPCSILGIHSMYASFNARAVGLADLSPAATIEIAAQAGFPAIDLMIRDIVRSGSDLTEIRARMDDRGLRAGAFPMTMDWRGDEISFRRGLAELPALARAAATLGCLRTGTWVLPETPVMPSPGTDFEQYRAEVASFHVARIGAVARVLAEHNIQLGLEVIGVASFRRGVGIPFITRLGELEPSLTDLLDEPNVGILADAWHLYAADEPFEAALAWGPGRIVWAHVADLPRDGKPEKSTLIDAERGLPGTTLAVDCRHFLTMLDDAGYDGPITAEPLARCEDLLGQEPIEVARRVKRSLDACWPRDGR